MIRNRQVSRYLFYAVGEIGLVVIGILLALQIDAWNKERTDRKKEIQYLREIHINLENDLNNVVYSIDFNREKDSIIQVCLTGMLQAKSDKEAMLKILGNMPLLAEFSVYTQNRVAFDNMLSAENIDLISNDSLRTGLSTFYSEATLLFGVQDRVKELTRQFVDNITPMLMNRETIEVVFGTPSAFDTAESLQFRKSRKVFGDLFGMQRNLDTHTIFLKSYEERIRNLLEQIDAFLSQQG
ncbi:MAG: DUF6090 family protein [Robiginitalea sp.]